MGRPLSGWTKRHKKTFGTRRKKWDGNFRQPPKPKYYWTVKKGRCRWCGGDIFKGDNDYVGEELRPGKNVEYDEVLDEIIRNTSDTAYHPSCTNKMGVDKMAVVNEETKVHGISNLRVVDSSIMPDIVSGNLNAATFMIGEKISDMILGKKEQPLDVETYN